MLKTEILKILRQSDSYVSGQDLCDRFGVSRTAVWKAVASLKKEGFNIDSVPNRGYLLVESPDVITSSEIESRLTTKWLGRNVISFEELDSTNNELKRMYEQSADIPDGTLVVTESQAAGRGRRGRSWENEKGSSIAMSFILKPSFAPWKASMLTILAAMAVARAIDEIADIDIKIKWPNDVVCGGKKICGILTEMSLEQDYIHYVIVGIGINVSTTSFSDEISAVATSVYKESGVKPARAELIALVMKHFEALYTEYEKVQDLAPFEKEYNDRLAGIGSRVRVLDPKGEYEGISRGINSTGELIVEKDDGEAVNVYAGEVSVRGIYGYV